MKMRVDFVSNSSSCSFIVNDPIKFKAAMDKLTDSNCYELDRFYTKVECCIEDKPAFKEYLYGNIYEYDGLCSFPVSVESILMMDASKISLLKSIELQCDDFDTENVFILSVLKKALEKMDVPVDSNSSEQPLLLEDNNDNVFITNICKTAFS